MDPYSSGKDLLVPAGAQCQASSIAHEQYGSFGTSGAVIFEGATGVLVALGYAGRVERAHVAYYSDCVALQAGAPPGGGCAAHTGSCLGTWWKTMVSVREA